MVSISRDRRRRLVASREMDARQEVARHDLATAMAKITVPSVRGRRWMVETKVAYGEVVLEIASPVLDMADIGVLLALLCIAARENGSGLTKAGGQSPGLLPAVRLGERNLASEIDCTMVECTVHNLAGVLGRNIRDGRTARAIRRSLIRLGQVVITATKKEGDWAATHLLHAVSKRGGRLVVGLNYRATLVIAGGGQYAAIPMMQWRQGTPVQQAVLYRLAVLTTGRLASVSIGTLVAACWAAPASSPKALQRRKERVRAAIRSGVAVPRGVSVRIDLQDIVRVRRVARDLEGPCA